MFTYKFLEIIFLKSSLYHGYAFIFSDTSMLMDENLREVYEWNCEHSPFIAFEEIMDLITKHGHTMNITQYEHGMGYIDGFDKVYKKLAGEEGFDWDKIVESAKKLKDEGHGDILHALNKLGNFTGPDDPRYNTDVKKDYLISVECFVLTARSYFDGYKLAIEQKEKGSGSFS